MPSAVFVSPHPVSINGGVPKPHGSNGSGGYITMNMKDRQAILFSERGDLLRDGKVFIRLIESEMKMSLHEVDRIILVINRVSVGVLEPLLGHLPPEKIVILVCQCVMQELKLSVLPGIVPVARCTDEDKMVLMIRGWLNYGRLPVSRTHSTVGQN